MAHTNSIDKTNKTKSNTYNNQSSNENIEELYNDHKTVLLYLDIVLMINKIMYKEGMIY